MLSVGRDPEIQTVKRYADPIKAPTTWEEAYATLEYIDELRSHGVPVPEIVHGDISKKTSKLCLFDFFLSDFLI